MTFVEIGNQLGVSAPRAHAIYKQALINLRKHHTEEEIMYILQDCPEPSTMWEAMEDAIYLDEQEDELAGFWNDDNIDE